MLPSVLPHHFPIHKQRALVQVAVSKDSGFEDIPHFIDLPNSRVRCWFAVVPRSVHELINYVMILDDFVAELRKSGPFFRHIMLWEPAHFTSPNSPGEIDDSYHITALAAANMCKGRFRAFAVHIYIAGDIPKATFQSYSSRFNWLRRGSREKCVVEQAKKINYDVIVKYAPSCTSAHFFWKEVKSSDSESDSYQSDSNSELMDLYSDSTESES